MKRIFKVTYWACFEDERNQSHSVSEFWFWEAPCFYKWMIEEMNTLNKEHDCSLVIVNCGKI